MKIVGSFILTEEHFWNGEMLASRSVRFADYDITELVYSQIDPVIQRSFLSPSTSIKKKFNELGFHESDRKTVLVDSAPYRNDIGDTADITRDDVNFENIFTVNGSRYLRYLFSSSNDRTFIFVFSNESHYKLLTLTEIQSDHCHVMNGLYRCLRKADFFCGTHTKMV